MSDTSATIVDTGSASWVFIFAHPGHELRVHHVLERVQPTVAVLTDGSGSTGKSRLDQTARLLAASGAARAPVFGPLTDRDAYAALQAVDARPFVALRDRLAVLLSRLGATAVLIDAAEGFNPVHDICHWMGRSAVQRTQGPGRRIDLFELDLVSHPDGAGSGPRLTLDDRAFVRKLEAVTGYDALVQEADAAFGHYGREAFRVEFLRRVREAPVPPASWVPYYEEVGEARVRAGRYASVLRYAQHVRPIIGALMGSQPSSLHEETLGTLHQ
jgi:hypothetical protein